MWVSVPVRGYVETMMIGLFMILIGVSVPVRGYVETEYNKTRPYKHGFPSP